MRPIIWWNWFTRAARENMSEHWKIGPPGSVSCESLLWTHLKWQTINAISTQLLLRLLLLLLTNEWMNWMAKRHNLWHNLAPFPNRVTISILLFIKIVNTIKRWILRDCLIHFGICYLSRPSPADVLLRLKSNEWHQRLWSTWNKINWC